MSNETTETCTHGVSLERRCAECDRHPLNIEPVTGEIAAVNLRPGDRLALMFDRRLSLDMQRHIHRAIESWAPGVPCIVLEEGARLAIVRAETDSE